MTLAVLVGAALWSVWPVDLSPRIGTGGLLVALLGVLATAARVGALSRKTRSELARADEEQRHRIVSLAERVELPKLRQQLLKAASSPDRGARHSGGEMQKNGSWFRSRRDEQDENLTRQFHLTLESLFERYRPESPTGHALKAVEKIEKLLETESWDAHYAIEHRLVDLYDRSMLLAELHRRVGETAKAVGPEAFEAAKQKGEELEAALAQAPDAASKEAVIEQLRALLRTLINDVQWSFSKQHSRRVFVRLATQNANRFFAVALLAFFGAFWATTTLLDGTERLWSLGVVAGAAGFWGASFSNLVGLRDRLEAATLGELKSQGRFTRTLSRGMIGLGAASILFFILLSGFVTGTGFPALDRQRDDAQLESMTGALAVVARNQAAVAAVAAPADLAATIDGAAKGIVAVIRSGATQDDATTAANGEKVLSRTTRLAAARIIAKASATPKKEDVAALAADFDAVVAGALAFSPRTIALLIFWSFAAGFSEKLVPQLLTNAEKRAAGAAPSATGWL